MDTNQTLVEIDQAHRAANQALEKKDLSTYLSHFSDDLKYVQQNGKIIDKRLLSVDIRAYIDRIKSLTSTYDRLSSSGDGDSFVEKIAQKATATLRIFIFFSKTWTVEREGIYEWKQVDGEWKISRVEIISEKVS